jgi:hypothetical protein
MREMIIQGRTTIEHLIQHALDYYSIMPDFNRKTKETTLRKVSNVLIQQVCCSLLILYSQVEIDNASDAVH